MKKKKNYKNVDLKWLISDSPFKGLWNLMYGFQGLYILAVLSLAVAALVKAVSLLFLRFVVDEVFGNTALMPKVGFFAAGFVGLMVVQAVLTFFKGKLSARSSEGATLRLRNTLYDHLQRLPYSFHDKNNTGDLIERVTSDVECINVFFSEQATQIGHFVATLLFNFTAIMLLSPLLGLLSVVFLPVILIISLWFFKRVTKAFNEYQEQEAVLSTVLQENISSVRVVRAFARKEYENERFEKENWKKYEKGKKLLRFHSFFWPITDIFCFMQTILIFLAGGFMVINGDITFGVFIAVIELVANIVWPMRELGRIVVEGSKALVSYDRIAKVLREVPEEDSIPLDLGKDLIKFGAVRFENVSFTYREGEPVLDGISLHCRPGEVIALLGATGSGKTSLVNLIPRFYDASSGGIWIDGIPVDEYSLKYLRRQIGIVEQEPFLFSGTVKENIRYGAVKSVSDRDIYDAAIAASIHDVIMEFPDKYETIVGERGVTLSGGQKQRLVLARTLLKDPRILIMDDATSSVDSETESAIKEALATLMKGRTCFIIAHRINTVQQADKIVVLEKGRIVQFGTHDALIREEGFYKSVFLKQSDLKIKGEKYVGMAV